MWKHSTAGLAMCMIARIYELGKKFAIDWSRSESRLVSPIAIVQLSMLQISHVMLRIITVCQMPTAPGFSEAGGANQKLSLL